MRPLATYSIVAHDPDTGQLGVAVQSHYFSVGPIVPWLEPGVGAVATQSLVRVAYGPEALALMRLGRRGPDALAALVAADENAAVRQVAVVDAQGNAAAHTGDGCIPEAGHAAGDGYSVQANLMASDTVWPAMAAAYEAADGDLPARLLAALEAAEGEGGDIRGRQSAALVVVSGTPTGRLWEDRRVDLRVEDHDRPVAELRRLLRLRRAYDLTDAGDGHLAEERFEDALDCYAEASALAPEVVELDFWTAVTLYTSGRREEGLARFREVFAREGRWVALVPRLAAVGMFPDDPERLAEVQAQASA